MRAQGLAWLIGWAFVALGAGVLLAGCSRSAVIGPPARPPTPPMLTSDEPPAEFAFGITVMTPTETVGSARPRAAGAPGARRVGPVRYVMEADWILRGAAGEGVSPDLFPPQRRQLTHEQARGLWRQLRDSGVLDPRHPGRVGSPPAYDPESRATVCVVSYSLEGTRGTVVLDSSEAASIRRLLDRLAELSGTRP